MTGKHYNWHKRWRLDVESASASHDTGLLVRFVALPQSEAQKVAHDAAGDAAIGQCWTTDNRLWGVVTTADCMRAVFDELKKHNGAGNAQQMLARLAREAGELWAHQKNQDH